MPGEAEREDFVAAVASYFVERRGRGMMLSPAEVALLEAWEQAGVTAAQARRGIAEAFRRDPEIRSLRQCRRAVEREARGRPEDGAR